MTGHNAEPSLRAVGGVGKGVDGRYFEWKLYPADSGEVDCQAEQVGTTRQGWQRPREGERKVELVGRLLLFGQQDDGVLEREQDSGVDVEGQVKVEWTP